MSLFSLMVREEYRMHVSYSSARFFLAMPGFVFAISFLVSLTIGNLEGDMSLRDVLISLNAGVFVYGVSVGAFGFIGRTSVERRQGQQNFLVALPALLPMSYRRTFLGMYLRDAFFYLALMLVPALAGLVAAAPLAHHSLLSIMWTFTALVLSFLFGLSLSFAVSVIGIRSRAAFGAVVAAILLALIGYGALNLYGIETVLPSLGLQFNVPPLGDDASLASAFLLVTVGACALLAAAATLLVPESYEGAPRKAGKREVLYPSYFRRFAFSGSFQPHLAKEFVDLVRSGALGKMVFTFIAPLLFLSFTTWYVNNGLSVPVGFNTVFYAAMVGFFGVMLYTWLTNVDAVDYYETLPVGVPQIIRAKLVAFFLLSLGISTAFVVAISLLNGETGLLWLALPVLYVTSAYMVVATSYLTGLRPHSSLFDPGVLSKFAVLSLLPDVSLSILSFSVDRSPLEAGGGIAAVLGVLALSALFFYRRLDRRWAGTGFN